MDSEYIWVKFHGFWKILININGFKNFDKFCWILLNFDNFFDGF